MGLDKLTALWNRIRDSLWFFPGVLTLAAAGLALVTIQLDVMGVLPDAPAGVWLFSGTASGARGVLTAIASGFITVTGVVFSVTIVAIQLASTQFTPRILRNFTADRANQLVLGVFIGTFTYALLVLRVVRGEQDGPAAGVTPSDLPGAGDGGAAPAAAAATIDAFVPNLSVTVAVALALVSIGFLIFFIDHAARSVQASVIIDRVTGETLRTLHRLLPDTVGVPADDDADAAIPAGQGDLVLARDSGYLQGVDQDALFRIIGEKGLVIRMEPQVGDFLLPGSPLATVWPATAPHDDATADAIRGAFLTGPQRTPHADPELGIIELVDIAVKALSPGINDPTTATLCVDRLAEVLLALARRETRNRVRRNPDDGGVLVLPGVDFDRLVRSAFDQIRHYGVENPHFAATLLRRLGELGTLVPPGRRPPIAREAAAALRLARDRIREPADLRRVENEAELALRRLGVGDAP